MGAVLRLGTWKGTRKVWLLTRASILGCMGCQDVTSVCLLGLGRVPEAMYRVLQQRIYSGSFSGQIKCRHRGRMGSGIAAFDISGLGLWIQGSGL